jgi:hypothetical protein
MKVSGFTVHWIPVLFVEQELVIDYDCCVVCAVTN